MAPEYLHVWVEVFPLEKLEEETEELPSVQEPSEPKDYLAEWRCIEHI